MRQLFTLRELLSIRSNCWRCVDCDKFWLDGQLVGRYPSIGEGQPDCRHPKLVRSMVVYQGEEKPRRKRRSHK